MAATPAMSIAPTWKGLPGGAAGREPGTAAADEDDHRDAAATSSEPLEAEQARRELETADRVRARHRQASATGLRPSRGARPPGSRPARRGAPSTR